MARLAPQGLHRCRLIAVVLTACALTASRPLRAQGTAPPLPSFDFRQAGAVAEWGELHDVSRIEATGQGMAVHLNGPDPYFSVPREIIRPGVPLLMKVHLRSSAGGGFQVFYFGPNARNQRGALGSRGRQARGLARADRVLLPPLGPGTRLRIDPPGSQRGLPDRVDPV